MRLNANLTEIFDSPVKIKLLKYIIKPGFMMTGREVSRICGTSVSNTINILKEFEDINLVTSRRAGKSVVWTARPESYAYFVANRLFGERNLFSAVEHLKQTLKGWAQLNKRYVDRVILFGSVAEGNEKSSSDIDLFVEIRSKEFKKDIEKLLEQLSLNCIKSYGNVLSPYILTKKEFQDMKGGELFKNIEKGGKIL
jgi:predicted nucleotidyltransferase